MTLLLWHSCYTDRGSYYELGLQRCQLPGRLDRANPTLLDTSPAASDEALLAPIAGAYYRPETLTDTQRQRTLQWVGRYAGAGARGRRAGTRTPRTHAKRQSQVRAAQLPGATCHRSR